MIVIAISTGVLAVCSAGLALVIVREGRRDRRVYARKVAAAARPAVDIPEAIRTELAAALARLDTACCLTAALSRGDDHDPTTCKGHQ